MSTEVAATIAAVRRQVAAARRAGRAIGFVPTMGALHAGHGALIDRARAECGFVAVSVFVNPTQFDRKDDYERYPRALETDVSFCGARGVDVVFAPDAAEMYPAAPKTSVTVAGVSEELCGRYRPGHFAGVATVVAKLFNIVQPDIAYFGEKDAQQLAIIQRMVRDLNIPVEIRPVATVREPDGLALSSRNQRLGADERRAAPVLHRGLTAASECIAAGCRSAVNVRRAALDVIALEPAVRVEYLEVVDPVEMTALAEITGPVRIAVAAWLGSVRLIDNVLWPPERT